MNNTPSEMNAILFALVPFFFFLFFAAWFLFGNNLKKPFARYRVKRMIAHSIPGYPSPCAARGEGIYCLTLRGAESAKKTMYDETSDGRGVYYGEIEKL